jgi:peptide/nickel transport system permease protein
MATTASPLTRDHLNEASSGPSLLRSLWRFCRQEPLASGMGVLTLVMILMALFAPFITSYAPNELVSEPLRDPSAEHPFGTDEFGRDLFTRIVYGARVSLAVGFLATGIGVALSFAIGITTAYAGGWVDYVVQRIVDAVQAVPAVVLLLGIVVALGPSLASIVLALSVRSGIVSSRVIRSATLGIRSADFIAAAEAVGATRARVIVRHLAPNVMPIALVLGSVSLSANIIAEASISFLGFGLKPPEPTWGRMLSDGRTYMLSAPILIIIPTTALAIVVLAANLLGDAVRDRLDPRLRV